MSIEIALQGYKDACRKNLVKYTVKAFQLLPEIKAPDILDIGCGSGVPTLELAWLCNGVIIGLDTNRFLLNFLEKKIKKAGLSDRVRTVQGSMFELNFPDESFDIIWSEGSIAVVGFERGLRDWRQLIKPDGYLAVFDESRGLSDKLKCITSSGYSLLDHFMVKGEIFWTEYYMPLQEYINNLKIEFRDDPKALVVLDNEQSEIDMVMHDPNILCSTFFIIQKT
jgi:ubiquinone/menaquinone biosynthesis C-methylase UbiE